MFDIAATAPGPNDIEWKTISIALRDADQARRGPRTRGGWSDRIRRLYVGLTGNQRLTTLANPRLEALRDFVEPTRRGGRIAEQAVPALAEHGFSRQIEAIALLAA